MMKLVGVALVLAVVAPNMAAADPWKDESGKGRWRDGYARFDRDWDDDRKVKFRTADGCEIERKFKKGEYEEKVKCKPGR
jgi:hypothetical protein